MKLHKNCFVILYIALAVLLAVLPTATLYARPMASITPTLTTHVSGQGTVTATPDKSAYSYGEMVSLTANPASGWHFAQWSGDLSPAIPWWDARWPYRVAITVDANGFERYDKPVEVALNFTSLLTTLGGSGAFADDSVHIVEVDDNGTVINDNVPWQFDKASDYNAITKATGLLTFLALGKTPDNATRLYHLYFDRAGGSYVPMVVAPLVTFTDNVTDERKSSFKVETPSGDYYYHKVGGGFSSFDDVDGNDWLSYSRSTGSAGAYRGLPNMIHPEGRFHPGSTDTTSVLEVNGPLKIAFRSTFTFSGQMWEALWEIFPHYARMTMLSAGHDYWFLYEGTPGGELDVHDRITFSDGTQVAWNGVYNKDIPSEEWAYASDPNVGAAGRSLYIIHHEDDNGKDSYRDLDERMTVLAFGRNADDNAKYINADNMPQHFTFGLMDEVDYAQASKIVRGAYKDLIVTTAAPETSNDTATVDPSAATLTLPMTFNRAITATFAQNYYALDLNVIDTEGAELDPALVQVSAPADPQGYIYGEVITLTANSGLGWTLQGWSGSASGNDGTATVTVDDNETVTATFSRSYYTVTATALDDDGQPTPENGVQVSASAAPAGYVWGETVTLTAIPAPGWRFQAWSGSASGNSTTTTLTVDSNETAVATFVRDHYSVTVSAVDGAGVAAPGSTVQLSPPAAAQGYLYGETVTVTAVAAPGWAFQRWSGSAGGNNATTTITIDGNENVIATFQRDFYSVTVSAVDGAGDPAGTSTVQLTAPANAQGYIYGEAVTATAVAAPGWQFIGWSGSVSGTAVTTAITVDSDEQVTAIFAPIHYTVHVTMVDESGQTVNAATVAISEPADPAGYHYGEQVTITLTPLSGWNFGRWEGDSDSEENPLTFAVAGNTTLRAVFANGKVKLTVRRLPTEGGSVTPPSGTLFNLGDLVTLTATPVAGWRFTGWSGDLSGATNPTTITMDGNKRVEANFVQEHYNIETAVSGQGSGFVAISTPANGIDYLYGETVTLTATAESGYRFVRWSVNNPAQLPVDFDATQPVVTFSVTGNLTFTARFESTDPAVNDETLYLPIVIR